MLLNMGPRTFRMVARAAPSEVLVAAGPARVGVVPASHGDELPAVKPRTQLQLQHTGGVDLLGLHARLVRAVLIAARSTTRAHYELADASCRRTITTGARRGERRRSYLTSLSELTRRKARGRLGPESFR
jgi:hypothetical protein